MQLPALLNRLLARIELVDAVQALVEVQDGSGLILPRGVGAQYRDGSSSIPPLEASLST